MSMPMRPVLAAIALFIAFLASPPASASVVIDGTRVILNESRGEASVNLTSRNDAPVLIQAWIDNGEPEALPDQIDVPFTLAPPLFRMNPSQKQAVRILALKNDLPTDRESVFYLNVLEIPPKPETPEFQDKNVLQIAIRSRLKLFYRPIGLDGDSSSAPSKLVWHVQEADGKSRFYVDNPTPYHVTISSMNFKGGLEDVQSPPPIMINPFESLEINVDLNKSYNNKSMNFDYTIVDDFGAFVKFSAKV